MAERVEVEGAARLQATMRACAAELQDLKAAHTAVAHQGAAASATRAPHRSGALAASVRGTSEKGAAVFSASVPYAGVIHYGWPGHNIAANPFMTGALTAKQSTWTDTYFRAVESAVSKIKGA